MAASKAKPKFKLTKAVHPSHPKWPFQVLTPDKATAAKLAKPFAFFGCDRPCTKLTTLLSKRLIEGRTGIGSSMVNVDGFRYINAYIISDPINSSAQRGFSLELSFAPHPFVLGVGVVGEARFHFNLENYFDPEHFDHPTLSMSTSDRTSLGGLPHIGGKDLTHLLRVPVMGPFVRASAFNEDTTARNATVEAYLTT
jgi:hypothetical protein